MNMHPDLLGQLAKDRQLQLSREAEGDRQIKLAHADSLSLSMRLRQGIGALLLRLGHAAQPRHAAFARMSRAPRREPDGISASAADA